MVVEAGRSYAQPTYYRKRPPVAVSGVVFHEEVLADDLTEADLLELALRGSYSSRPAMVGNEGLEPPTSSV